MVVGNEVIGTLGIDILTEDVRFTSEELRLAETLVFQAATAVQNARLFEQVQSRARQERILREVSDRVYAAPDAETVLNTAAQEINRLLGLETVAYVGERPIFNESNGKSQSVNGH
jgi:GAF domain-containing protein